MKPRILEGRCGRTGRAMIRQRAIATRRVEGRTLNMSDRSNGKAPLPSRVLPAVARGSLFGQKS
ncbi:hypothetical protein ASF29_20570 [Rhizobium sp. Leaf262]|nr:hypothetical protein ASF29_20570 [Rhizobium sp. Leaf262]